MQRQIVAVAVILVLDTPVWAVAGAVAAHVRADASITDTGASTGTGPGTASRHAGTEWTVIQGHDNTRDLTPCCQYGKNISSLKAECEANKWCAGFSSFFGQLKYSVEGLAPQGNTDVYVRHPAPAKPPTVPVYLWPRPSRFVAGDRKVSLGGPFKFSATGLKSSLLADTFERYETILQAPAAIPGTPAIRGCNVRVLSADHALGIDTDEAYNLTVPDREGDPHCTIEATTVYGAMRGLETFSQLWNTADRTFAGAPLTVQDAPRYRHRGLMQDTARHFLPLPVLLEHLEAMAAAKLNVFHWHLTDTQSWPLQLQSLPLASARAAYDPVEAVYSAADIATVVDAARRRGIRVIPELDMPAAHFSSILKGYPSFGAGKTAAGTLSLNLDPTNEEMWGAMENMFAELAGLFPDAVLHVGFDEVDLSQWNTSAITAWMKTRSMAGGLKDVESYFLQRVRTIAKGHGKRLTIWDDPVGEGVQVDPDVQLHVWNQGMPLVRKLSAQGYKQVYSAPFYLDDLKNAWGTIYENQDLDTDLPGVLGAEAAMWGEHVDETNAVARVWPRAAVLGEVLWSPDYTHYPRIAGLNEARLAYWRCGVRARGVSAEPIAPGWCPRKPH